jgi:hypothetical protein
MIMQILKVVIYQNWNREDLCILTDWFSKLVSKIMIWNSQIQVDILYVRITTTLGLLSAYECSNSHCYEDHKVHLGGLYSCIAPVSFKHVKQQLDCWTVAYNVPCQ